MSEGPVAVENALSNVADYTNASFHVHVSQTDFVHRKDGPVKQAITKMIKEHNRITDVYTKATVQPDKSVKVEIVGHNEEENYCNRHRRIFGETPEFDDNPLIRGETLTVTKQDAKDFFGTKVVQTAVEWNRPIVRDIDVGTHV